MDFSESLKNVIVVGVMEAEMTGVLKLLLSDNTTLEIDEQLWEPFDDLLKLDKLMVNIEKAARKITAITLV